LKKPKPQKHELVLDDEHVRILDHVLRSMWRGAHPGPVVRRQAFRELAATIHALLPAPVSES
jgi:hypothetical protein